MESAGFSEELVNLLCCICWRERGVGLNTHIENVQDSMINDPWTWKDEIEGGQLSHDDGTTSSSGRDRT